MHTASLPPRRALDGFRPWWRRVLPAELGRVVAGCWGPWSGAKAAAADAVADAADPTGWTAAQRAALRHLPARTLRDIGAPEWAGDDDRRAAGRVLDQLRL